MEQQARDCKNIFHAPISARPWVIRPSGILVTGACDSHFVGKLANRSRFITFRQKHWMAASETTASSNFLGRANCAFSDACPLQVAIASFYVSF